jgi:hypothetical protein
MFPPMKRKSSKPAPRWRVTQIGGSRGREICELEAATADAAIKRAVREYGIDDPHRQSRLAAYRVA